MKEKFIAYLLGFLFGGFGVHRMYCGQVGLGILQLVTVLLVFGIIWVLLDVFLTSPLVDATNDRIVNDIVARQQMLMA